MTDLFKTSKVISALPSVIEPNTTYWVRTGLGFDLYLSDSTGDTVHKINGTPPYIPVPYNFTVNGDATLNTSISQTSDVTAAITLANSGVTAGTYGSSTEVPAIVVDLKGRVTKVTNTPIRPSSTTQSGIVQLSTSTNSSSVSTAATSSAVKATYDLALAAIPNSKFGTALGVATLDATGKIPSGQLPSYVDDVMEFATEFEFPNPGESGKLYVELSSNKIFRWTGTTYVNISGGSEIADAALKLYTARSFSLTGGATSNIVNFDGTGNVTLTINGLNPDTLTKAVPIVKGGTGATTVEAARTNLGLGAAATKNVGGTNGLLELSGSKVPSSNLPEASVTQAGIVMLNDTYESDSVATSPTSRIFKSLYESFVFLLGALEEFINTKAKPSGLASLDASGKLPTAQLTTHTHTASDIGLGNVNNTSDLAKPISTLTQTALNGKANTSHTHTPAQVGLGNVNNTSDISKPISTATQNALNGKANTSHSHDPGQVNGIRVIDSRSEETLPNQIYSNAISAHFKQKNVINNPPVTVQSPDDTYAHIINVSGWSTNENSGGWPSQIAFGDSLAVRQATSPTTWGSWNRLAHQSSIDDLYYNKANSISLGSTADPNTTQESYILTNHSNGPQPQSLYWHINTFFYSSKSEGRGQIAVSYHQSPPRFAFRNNYGDVWTEWQYAATKQDINNLVNFTHVGPTAPSTSGLAVNSVWLDTSTEV